MRTVTIVSKVHIVALDQFVGSASLCRHKALVVDEELADPGTDCNHVNEHDNKSDPFRPSEQELLFTLINLTTLTEAP